MCEFPSKVAVRLQMLCMLVPSSFPEINVYEKRLFCLQNVLSLSSCKSFLYGGVGDGGGGVGRTLFKIRWRRPLTPDDSNRTSQKTQPVVLLIPGLSCLLLS